VSCAELPVLTVEGLCKSYRDGDTQLEVLNDLSFSLAPQEMLVLWGPSGSGKSTLLNLLAGVVEADSGQLSVRDRYGQLHTYGRRPSAATTHIRRCLIGYVFQFFNLVPTLTVAENIELTLKLSAADSQQQPADRERLHQEALATAQVLGLQALLDKFPDALSGGEQQRAAIVRALAHQPQLLLADEPTGNLDSHNANLVIDALFAQLQDTGCALVVATHDPAIAERAHRVITLPC